MHPLNFSLLTKSNIIKENDWGISKLRKNFFKTWPGILSILAVVIILAGSLVWWHRAQAAEQYVQSKTPTFFFHGYGSSRHAEEHMANAAKRAGATNTIIWANVDRSGHVTFHGKIKKNAVNPIIEVNYENPREVNYHTDGQWAYNVLSAAKQKWGFKKMNLVGHSMGNMDIMYCLLDHPNSSKLPKLQKQIDIAGHFNGLKGQDQASSKLDASGKPAQTDSYYRELTKLRQTYPTGVKVLNIYGNLQDGSHSDGTVPNNSSKSLRYLISPRAKSYTEREIKGARAQHSKLHSNAQVDRLLIDFLWAK